MARRLVAPARHNLLDIFTQERTSAARLAATHEILLVAWPYVPSRGQRISGGSAR